MRQAIAHIALVVRDYDEAIAFTDDFWRDYRALVSRSIAFVREPGEEEYGTVAVFEDVYGNRWDLVEPASA